MTGLLPKAQPVVGPRRGPRIPSGRRETHLLPPGRPDRTLCGDLLTDRVYTTHTPASATCYSCCRIRDEQKEQAQ